MDPCLMVQEIPQDKTDYLNNAFSKKNYNAVYYYYYYYYYYYSYMHCSESYGASSTKGCDLEKWARAS